MIIVVGGGPAGMAAALSAAQANSKVMVVEAGPRLGGQYWRHSSVEHLDQDGAKLVSAVMSHPNIEFLFNARIWRADYRDGESTLHVLIFGKSRELTTKKLILATGAFDRTLPFPGWDIPGVMTPGAAQSLLKGSGIVAGKRIVIAGTGPFLLPVSVGLAKAGAQIAGLYEANSRNRWFPHALTVMRNAPKLRLALSFQRELKRYQLRFRGGYAVVEALKGDEGLLEAVRVAKVDKEFGIMANSEFVIKCDVLAVGWGFTADLSLAGNLGVEFKKDSDGSISVVVDQFQETSLTGVFAAGELTGIGGAELAQVEGEIAGLTAAGNVNRPKRLHRLKKRKATFARALSAAYPVGNKWMEWLRESTIICRCEEVSLSEVEKSISNLGATDARSAKLLTRAGMGLCQGRICGRSFADIVESRTGNVANDESSIKFAARPIASPITFEELAGS
ncbi:MAG: FAD-dependent oxidoreductase [Actinobacteria bacterium]|nr:FAD-dependent oxidoreductase [Actinomycetota bacterium]